MRPEAAPGAAAALAGVALTPRLGSRIDTLDLAGPLDEATVSALRMLLLDRGLLVFTGQHHLTPAAQLAFAARFGPIDWPPAGVGPHPGVVRLIHGPGAPPTENIWHSDQSFRPAPPLGAVLRAVELPDVGGDTLFADMRLAWQGLDPTLRAIAAALTAEHDIACHAPAEKQAELRSAVPAIRHPIARMHPETGEPILYVNQAYSTRIIGLDDNDARALLLHLAAQVAIPEYQCRLRWEPGMVVLWDNRSLQHYAVGDYMPARRVMDRVSIAGTAVCGMPRSEAG